MLQCSSSEFPSYIFQFQYSCSYSHFRLRSLECFETQDNLLLSNSGTLVLNTRFCPTQQPFEPTLETEIHTGIYPTQGYTMLKGMPRNCGPPPLPSLQTISLDTLLVYRRLLVDVIPGATELSNSKPQTWNLSNLERRRSAGQELQ